MNSEPQPKVCPTCPREVGLQPIENFGMCRARSDGRNLYCKPCARERVRAFRKGLSQHGAEARADVERKANVMILEPRSPGLSHAASVLLATLPPEGLTQRELVRAFRAAKFPFASGQNEHSDTVADALAELYDEGLIKFDRHADSDARRYAARKRMIA